MAALVPALAYAQSSSDSAIYSIFFCGAVFIAIIALLIFAIGMIIRSVVRRVSDTVTSTVSSASYSLSKGVVDGILDTPSHASSNRAVTMPDYHEHEHHGQEVVVKEVIREIVKMPCEYCGTPVDVTAIKCPSSGAPMTFGHSKR